MARQRGNSWQGSLKTKEKYYRFSFPTEALAEEWEREARAAHKAGLPIPEPTVINQTSPTLARFFKDHRDVIWPKTLPRNTSSNQKAVERFMGGDTLIHHITEKKLVEMVSKMIRAGNKPSTINTRLSHLKVLLRHAKRLGMVDAELDYPWQEKGDNSRLRFLTEEEESQLLALFNHWGIPEVAQMVSVLIDTGCRPGELFRGETLGEPIRWSEVSKSAGGTAPDVNDPNTGKAKAVISLMRTKTKQYRVLPLTDRAKQAFLASKERGDKRPFGDMRCDTLSDHMRAAADHLGMNDVVLYTTRHTCASRLVQRGADLRRVKDWMGHETINTTLRYAKLTPTDIFKLEALL